MSVKYSFSMLAIVALCSSSAFGQSGDASAKGQCSAANTGDNNRFTINCGIGKQQGEQMLAILNKILSNSEKLPADLVIQKLDEILRRVNPNADITTYTCEGEIRISGTSPHSFHREIVGGTVDMKEATAMTEAYNQRRWHDLKTACEGLIIRYLGWLTPVLFCSVASQELGDRNHAIELLRQYDVETGPGYTEDPMCKSLSTKQHRALNFPEPR